MVIKAIYDEMKNKKNSTRKMEIMVSLDEVSIGHLRESY